MVERLKVTEQPHIEVGPSILSDVDEALSLEWIVTNGLGGYASSTVLGVNTRKYHGLLVAAFNPPLKRYVLLTNLEEELRIERGKNDEDIKYYLSSNEFKDMIRPPSYRHWIGFSLSPFPTFRYEAGGLYVTKSILMPYLKNVVICSYTVLNTLDEPVRFTVSPLLNMRHIYEVTDRRVKPLKFLQKPLGNRVLVRVESLPYNLVVSATEGEYIPSSEDEIWIDRIYFRVDSSRGENCLDDNYRPGFFTVSLEPGEAKRLHIVAASGLTEAEALSLCSETESNESVREIFRSEETRRARLLRSSFQSLSRRGVRLNVWLEEGLKWLIASTDLFLTLKRPTGLKSIIAGYHWFGEWGRDSMISLPGLTLVTGRFSLARDVLLNFSRYCRQGLIPNSFPEGVHDSEPSYNSVDASLWFVNAVFHYVKYTGDMEFVSRRLWGTLKSIIEAYIEGTLFGIRMDSSCLIEHGPRLTWMDAAVGGVPATPRGGKAVEVEALWYNALRVMEALASRLGFSDEAHRYSSIAYEAYESFNREFWNPKGGYLFDVVEGGRRDSSLRPNQIIAVSLDFPILEGLRAARVVEVVWRRLWATYGLRTLDRDDPEYVGCYIGDWAHRDKAYHNGTVWTWLLGPFVTAFLKVRRHEERWRRFAIEAFFRPLFVDEPFRAGLGTFSEIFDGDPPHTPRGCISQAWSVAEPLRSLVEDALYLRPPFECDFLG